MDARYRTASFVGAVFAAAFGGAMAMAQQAPAGQGGAPAGAPGGGGAGGGGRRPRRRRGGGGILHGGRRQQGRRGHSRRNADDVRSVVRRVGQREGRVG